MEMQKKETRLFDWRLGLGAICILGGIVVGIITIPTMIRVMVSDWGNIKLMVVEGFAAFMLFIGIGVLLWLLLRLITEFHRHLRETHGKHQEH